MRSPYEVLGISPGASIDEAEDAYYRLLRLEHPDLHHGAGPERIVQAEQRTRELNAAIWALRSGAAARVDIGASAGPTRGTADPGRATDGATTAEPPPGRTAPPGGQTWDDDWDPGDTWDGRRREWQPPSSPREPATATCPWCGRQFLRAVDLKDHVFDDHDLRLDRKERGSLLGGRVRRLTRKAAHLPLWTVIPLNVLVATVIGLLVAAPTDEMVGWWSAAIAMSPTAVVLIDRLGDIDI